MNSVNGSLSGGTGTSKVPCSLLRPPTPQLQTWYLLVELKGISTSLGYRSRISFTDPQHSSMHFRSADSEASPATARCGHRRHRSGSPEMLHRGATSDAGEGPPPPPSPTHIVV